MAKKVAVKPVKKTTVELFEAIKHSLQNGEYYFSDHGDVRSKTRKNVNDLEVVKILAGNDKWHEAAKDKYEKGRKDWNYHIRGRNIDEDQIRIAISFDEDGMVVITVINLDEDEE